MISGHRNLLSQSVNISNSQFQNDFIKSQQRVSQAFNLSTNRATTEDLMAFTDRSICNISSVSSPQRIEEANIGLPQLKYESGHQIQYQYNLQSLLKKQTGSVGGFTNRTSPRNDSIFSSSKVSGVPSATYLPGKIGVQAKNHHGENVDKIKVQSMLNMKEGPPNMVYYTACWKGGEYQFMITHYPTDSNIGSHLELKVKIGDTTVSTKILDCKEMKT